MIVLPLGGPWGPFFSSSALARFVFVFLWRRGSPSTLRRPFWPPPRPPRFPQGPFREPKCTRLYNKTNDFAGPPVCPKLSPRVPDQPPKAPPGAPKEPPRMAQGPPGAPKEPPRMAQGPPRIPKRIHARPRGSPKEPLGHPRDTQGHPKPAQELPTDRQGPPKQLAFMYQLRAGAWCARFTGGPLV